MKVTSYYMEKLIYKEISILSLQSHWCKRISLTTKTYYRKL